ncbi:hypothetical protein RvY_05449-5 [Ramazzottius varieornatus]|uniref:Uncharacterized protein n=1 Tax=Ramazzottius varieornatus TaxID=947166 RepID=A0A1D1UV33_RAMVA|nr:hypothetical protein RvY_05449-5 [Ramazzottius varieornatus]
MPVQDECQKLYGGGYGENQAYREWCSMLFQQGRKLLGRSSSLEARWEKTGVRKICTQGKRWQVNLQPSFVDTVLPVRCDNCFFCNRTAFLRETTGHALRSIIS